MRKIVRLKYRDGESIVEHINTFMGYVNQLAAAKFPLDDAMQAILLMCTLPDSWENLVVTLSSSCQEENLSLQVVKTSIFNEESRRTKVSCPSQSQMWLNIPAEEETDIEVHRGGTNPMPGLSPKVSSHVSIAESMDTSRRIVDTLRRTKVPQKMSNPERFLRRRAH